MGNLKPGATYIYERNGDTVYARESGADPSTRKEIGWNFDPNRWDHLERQERRRPGAVLDHRPLRGDDGRGHRRRWLAHHPHDGPQDGEAAASPRFRGRDRRRDHDHRRLRTRHPAFHDARHLDLHPRRRRVEAFRRGAMGPGRTYRLGLGPDHPDHADARLPVLPRHGAGGLVEVSQG